MCDQMRQSEIDMQEAKQPILVDSIDVVGVETVLWSEQTKQRLELRIIARGYRFAFPRGYAGVRTLAESRLHAI